MDGYIFTSFQWFGGTNECYIGPPQPTWVCPIETDMDDHTEDCKVGMIHESPCCCGFEADMDEIEKAFREWCTAHSDPHEIPAGELQWETLEDVDELRGAWNAATRRERERCLTRALEQRCERDTDYDRGVMAAAAAIREE
jgi:hypothetical protein